MINIKGGVVSIGRNDTLQGMTVSEAIIVVDIEGKKLNKQVVSEWLAERVEEDVVFDKCQIMNSGAYAKHVMEQAMTTSAKEVKPVRKVKANKLAGFLFISVIVLAVLSLTTETFAPIMPYLIGALGFHLLGMGAVSYARFKNRVTTEPEGAEK